MMIMMMNFLLLGDDRLDIEEFESAMKQLENS